MYTRRLSHSKHFITFQPLTTTDARRLFFFCAAVGGAPPNPPTVFSLIDVAAAAATAAPAESPLLAEAPLEFDEEEALSSVAEASSAVERSAATGAKLVE